MDRDYEWVKQVRAGNRIKIYVFEKDEYLTLKEMIELPECKAPCVRILRERIVRIT